MAELTSVQEDEEAGKIVPVNKITLAPGTEDEYTYLLDRHVGKAGRDKDFAILKFMGKAEGGNDMSFFIDNQEEFVKIAVQTLDLDLKEHKHMLEKLGVFDLINGFTAAIDFRINGMNSKEAVEEATKK